MERFGLGRSQAHPIYDAFGAKYPVSRTVIPEEIANAILYSASDEASFCTGTILLVDGGHIAGNVNLTDIQNDYKKNVGD